MAISFVQAATMVVHDAVSGSLGIALTGVGAGNTLVKFGAIFNLNTGFTISGVSDGSAFTVRSGVHTVPGDHRQYSMVAYRANVGGGSHTVTTTLSGATGGQTYAALGLAEFSGVETVSPEDAFDSNDDQLIASNDVNAGPITTTEAGDLILGAAEIPADSATSLAWSSPANWTNLYRQNDGFSSGTGFDAGYWLPGSIQTTYTPQWAHRNIGGGSEGSAVVVALKAAAGGGGGGTNESILVMFRDAVKAIGAGWKRNRDGRLLVPAYPMLKVH